jgi:hypothetical protein
LRGNDNVTTTYQIVGAKWLFENSRSKGAGDRMGLKLEGDDKLLKHNTTYTKLCRL